MHENQQPQTEAFELSEAERAAIEHEMHHYEDPRAASIEALKIVQKQRGWVPDGAIYEIAKVLGIPANYYVEVIPSGCCGMAGSFGYEKEHYEVSMKVGELVLLPAVRNAAAGTIIAASGTSCRHQIKDGTGRKSLHPVEVLWNALK